MHSNFNPVVVIMRGFKEFWQILVPTIFVGDHRFFEIAFGYACAMAKQGLLSDAMQSNIPDGKAITQAVIVFSSLGQLDIGLGLNQPFMQVL